MPFEPKKWVSEKDPLGPPADSKKATKISGAALTDLEERVTGYADTKIAASLAESGIGLNHHGEDAEAGRLEEFKTNLWVGSVSPVNMTGDDIFIDEAGLSAEDIEGLGDAALLDVGTTAGTVAAGDDSRFGDEKKAREEADATLTSAVAGKQAALGYTPENVANKDTDTALAANSDTKYPSQKAVKSYIDGLLAASDAVIYKGALDCSGNPKYPAASAGHLYRVSVAGKIGGGSGINVEVGDTLLCNTDGSAEGSQAEVGSKWNVIQANIDGAVVGPTSATDGAVAKFDGTTGKLLKDGVILGTAATQASTAFDAAGAALTEEVRALAAEALLAPRLPNKIVVPMIAPNLLDSAHTNAVANTALFVRCVIPATGTLKDVSAFIAVKAGSAILGVYDVGEAAAGKYTRLKVSGEVELTVEGAWITLWASPGLAVTKGQQIMLAINFNNATAKYGQSTAYANAGANRLPNSFLGATGVTIAQLSGQRAVGSFALPETLEENLLATGTTNGILLIARVE